MSILHGNVIPVGSRFVGLALSSVLMTAQAKALSLVLIVGQTVDTIQNKGEEAMDKPYEELEPILLGLIADGHTWHGKFTCQHCGARQTFEEPELLFTQGVCEECGQTSLLNRWGFIAVMRGGK